MISIRICSLDQARLTGFAVFDDGQLVEHGTIELGNKRDTYENILFSARQKIQSLINDAKIEVVLLEDIQCQKQNIGTFKKLALLQGALISLFQEKEYLYHIISPTAWRAGCGIRGRKRSEQKANTILFVQENYGLEDVSEDVADAVAMGNFFINNIQIISKAED